MENPYISTMELKKQTEISLLDIKLRMKLLFL